MVRLLHILYIIIGGVLLASCGLDGSSFRIKGHFRDMQSGELYIYNISSHDARLDTLTIKNGKFLYRGQAEEVAPYMLVFQNGMEQVIFVGPGEDLEYEATANDLKNYVVNGSEENKLMNQFRQETYTFNPAQVTQTARSYIREHAQSPVAVYLFDRYFLQDDTVSNSELAKMVKTLKAHHPENRLLLSMDSKLVYNKQISIGKKLPNVTLKQKDKTEKKLWTKQKDYNLIVFWATWMPNSYDFLWRLRHSYEPYKDAGRLRMVTISLDIERYRWEDAIRQDSVSSIEHYCDGLSFESKTAKTFGVSALPYYILTDKDHKILEKSDDIGDLDKTLEKYLKKP